MPLHRTYFHDIERPEKIAPALQRLVDYMNGNEFRAHHPIKQASVAHWKFMQIFPFTNHTGTVGRLMLSLILIRHGYLPLVIHAIDRQRYYESLRHPEPTLRALVMECMHNSIENGFKFFRPIEEPRESTAG
jgi:Fic family protein